MCNAGALLLTRRSLETTPNGESCYAEYRIRSKKNQYPLLEASIDVINKRVIGALYIIKFNSSYGDTFGFQYGINGYKYSEKQFITDTINYAVKNDVLSDVLVLLCVQQQINYVKEIYLHKAQGLVGFTTVDGKEYKQVE